MATIAEWLRSEAPGASAEMLRAKLADVHAERAAAEDSIVALRGAREACLLDAPDEQIAEIDAELGRLALAVERYEVIQPRLDALLAARLAEDAVAVRRAARLSYLDELVRYRDDWAAFAARGAEMLDMYRRAQRHLDGLDAPPVINAEFQILVLDRNIATLVDERDRAAKANGKANGHAAADGDRVAVRLMRAWSGHAPDAEILIDRTTAAGLIQGGTAIPAAGAPKASGGKGRRPMFAPGSRVPMVLMRDCIHGATGSTVEFDATTAEALFTEGAARQATTTESAHA